MMNEIYDTYESTISLVKADCATVRLWYHTTRKVFIALYMCIWIYLTICTHNEFCHTRAHHAWCMVPFSTLSARCQLLGAIGHCAMHLYYIMRWGIVREPWNRQALLHMYTAPVPKQANRRWKRSLLFKLERLPPEAFSDVRASMEHQSSAALLGGRACLSAEGWLWSELALVVVRDSWLDRTFSIGTEKSLDEYGRKGLGGGTGGLMARLTRFLPAGATCQVQEGGEILCRVHAWLMRTGLSHQGHSNSTTAAGWLAAMRTCARGSFLPLQLQAGVAAVRPGHFLFMREWQGRGLSRLWCLCAAGALVAFHSRARCAVLCRERTT